MLGAVLPSLGKVQAAILNTLPNQYAQPPPNCPLPPTAAGPIGTRSPWSRSRTSYCPGQTRPQHAQPSPGISSRGRGTSDRAAPRSPTPQVDRAVRTAWVRSLRLRRRVTSFHLEPVPNSSCMIASTASRTRKGNRENAAGHPRTRLTGSAFRRDLLRAQRLRGIQTRGPPRRQPARECRHAYQYRRGAGIGGRVGRLDAVEQPLEHACQAERSSDTRD